MNVLMHREKGIWQDLLIIVANLIVRLKNGFFLPKFFYCSKVFNLKLFKRHVLGEIRIGIFAIRDIKYEEELTFDYQFERFGGKKQKCYCGEDNCRGYLGAKPKQSLEIQMKQVNTISFWHIALSKWNSSN